jgi:hypothetical protein
VVPWSLSVAARSDASPGWRATASSKAAALRAVSWANGAGVVDVALLQDGPV